MSIATKFRGPEFFDTDMSVQKRLEFHIGNPGVSRWPNLYDLFNHPEFADSTTALSGTFGAIQSTVSVHNQYLTGLFTGAAASP